MENLLGVVFMMKTTIEKIEKKDGDLHATFNTPKGQKSGIFDTVVYAAGRTPNTDQLALEKVGIVPEKNGKIKCVNERTTIPNIYAVGDVVFGIPELTPVATQSTKLLLDRLYGGSTDRMDYQNIASCMFLAPREYSFVGLSEAKAKEVFGDKVAVFTSSWTPAYWAFVSRFFYLSL
ncbi:hypothetical protein GEMRC1_009426 [Eukaryota sp. GEM-RC1]